MKTPFMALTIGDMFVDAPGILSGLTVTVEDTTTWELDDGLQFPHYIKAACEFKYIGTRKLSTTGHHYDLGERNPSVFTDKDGIVSKVNKYRLPLPQTPILVQQETVKAGVANSVAKK